jgi:hypothetical protein
MIQVRASCGEIAESHFVLGKLRPKSGIRANDSTTTHAHL